MISPRPAVQTLPPYHAPHEGRLNAVRLDFNENTEGFALPLGFQPAELANAYPEYAETTADIARLLGVKPDQVLLTNGSDEALFLVPFTFISPGDKALVNQPTFQMIPHYLHLCGAETLAVPVQTDTLTLDLTAWEQALATHQPRLVMLPSPDNPTGATIGLQTWESWLMQYPHTLFVLDQAYGEYEADDMAFLRLVDNYPNLLITRTFSKAWGLAGFRLGILLGQARLIAWLATVRSPFSVNMAALQAVRHLLPQAAKVRQAAQQACERKTGLMAELAKRGIVVHAAGGNFMLLNLGLDAVLFCRTMAQQGILVRDRSSVPGLWGYVRVSVGTYTECDTFLKAVDAYHRTTVLMFDLDDTLVDTSASFDTVVMQLVETHSSQPLSREDLLALRAEGGFNDDWVSTLELLRRRGITHVSHGQIAREGTRLYLERARQSEQLMVSLDELHRLKRRFARLAIATGRTRQEYQVVWAAELDPVFDCVACVDDEPHFQSKPHPDSLLWAMAQTGTDRGYYIGNAVDDMIAGLAAGLQPVGVVKTLSAEQLKQAGAMEVMSGIDRLARFFPVAK